MGPRELASYYAEQQQHARGLTATPPKPTFYYTVRERIEREAEVKACEERRRREEEAGVSAWDEQRQEIEDTQAADLREAVEACRQAEAAARERAEQARQELGARPALNDPEVIARGPWIPPSSAGPSRPPKTPTRSVWLSGPTRSSRLAKSGGRHGLQKGRRS